MLSLIALDNHDAILRSGNQIAVDNLALLDQFFLEYSGYLSWARSQEGRVGFVRSLRDKSVEEFCNHLLKDMGGSFNASKYVRYGG